MDTSVNTQATLGQRIDALIEPLNAQAEQHRAALQQARVQIQQVKQQIDHSEQSLREIEQQMVAVLHALAAEEPMLAKAMGTQLPAVVPVQAAAPAGIPLGISAPPPAPHVPTPAEDDACVAEIAGLLDDIEAEEQAMPAAPPAAVLAPDTIPAPPMEQLSPEDARARDEMLAIIETGTRPSDGTETEKPSPTLEAAVQHAADVASELEQPAIPPSMLDLE